MLLLGTCMCKVDLDRAVQLKLGCVGARGWAGGLGPGPCRTRQRAGSKTQHGMSTWEWDLPRGGKLLQVVWNQGKKYFEKL